MSRPAGGLQPYPQDFPQRDRALRALGYHCKPMPQ